MITELTGGLANQALMWAFGQSMSLQRQEPVYYNWKKSTWNYALDAYGIPLEQALCENLRKIYLEPSFNFDPDAIKQPFGTYFRGYWQSERYLEKHADVIRQKLVIQRELSPYSFEMLDLIQNTNSVALHVRRGDYLTPMTAKFHGAPGMDYYQQALSLVREKIGDMKVFVFSDDPNWCREHLNAFWIIDSGNQHEDLELMKNCKHGIMANSTYGWLANWLGDYPGRVVVAPKKWFNDPNVNTVDLIPSRWITL